MSSYRTLVPVIGAVAVLAAACSSGGGNSTPPSAATLKGVVLKQSDLPSGWTGKAAAAQNNAKNKQVSNEIAKCAGVAGGGSKGQLKDVASEDFSMGQSSISSDATSYKTAGDVQLQVQLLKNPKTEGCLNTIFKKDIAAGLPSSATVASESLHLDTGSNQLSSNVVGSVSGSITVRVSGRSVTEYLAEEFVTGHQLTATVSFSALGTPLSSSLTTSVTKAVAKRASSA